jgi:hypothetical protein
MPTVTTNANFPPQTFQIAMGTGTLLRVEPHVPNSNATEVSEPGIAGVNFGSAMDADLYNGDPHNGGTRLISVSRSSSEPLTLPFTSGLFIVQRSGSSIDTTYTTN